MAWCVERMKREVKIRGEKSGRSHVEGFYRMERGALSPCIVSARRQSGRNFVLSKSNEVKAEKSDFYRVTTDTRRKSYTPYKRSPLSPHSVYPSTLFSQIQCSKISNGTSRKSTTTARNT